jgi:hypothetical protein
MEKIRLDFDALQVESFATARVPEERGDDASCPCGTSKIGGCWCTECC